VSLTKLKWKAGWEIMVIPRIIGIGALRLFFGDKKIKLFLEIGSSATVYDKAEVIRWLASDAVFNWYRYAFV
jgi:hypothetical protein